MRRSFKKSLVLLIAVIYTVFACNYVAFCNRNTTTINLLQSIKVIFTKQGVKTAEAINWFLAKKSQGKTKFLSRPRVINQKMPVVDFSVVASLFLLLFVTFSFSNHFFLFVNTFHQPNPYPGIVFLNNWRI